MTSNQGTGAFGSGGVGSSGGSLFNAPTTTGSSTPSIFGTTTTPGQSSSIGGGPFSTDAAKSTVPTFGGGSNTTGVGGGGLFGASGAPGTSSISGGLFGAKPPNPTTTSIASAPTASSLFGGATANTNKVGSANTGNPSMFGTGSQTPAGAGNYFGSQLSAPSSSPAGPPPATSTGNFFGTQATTSKPGNIIFGGPSTTPTPTTPSLDTSAKPPVPLFGGSTQPNTLFGGAPKAPGATEKPPNTGLSFGSTTSTGGGIFSTKQASPAPTTTPSSGQSLFSPTGTQSTAKPTENKTPGGLFGSNQNTGSSLFSGAQQAASAAKPGVLFGAAVVAPTPSTTTPATAAAAAPSLFGQAPTSPPTQKPAGSFFAGGPADTKTGTASTPSLFGATSTSGAPVAAPATTSATSTSLFGKPTATTTPSATAQQSSTPAAAPATASALPGVGLFNAATTTSATSPVTDASKTGGDTSKTAQSQMASVASLGPPAQSRLKNKSIAEIMARWLNDTQKYKQQFLKQAEEIKKWDQMLVENGEKISKLLNDTSEEEKKQNTVETQLSYLENEQNELSDVLDHYEEQVKDLFEGQMGGYEGMQPADQEREKTYHLAQRLNDQLAQMNKDLEGMIVEINQASAAINKTTNQDDPLSQIVKVLNNHLSALQWIDSHTTAIQERIKEAQQYTSIPSASYTEDEFLASHASLKSLR